MFLLWTLVLLWPKCPSSDCSRFANKVFGNSRQDGWQKQQQQLMTMKAGWTISHSLSSKEETTLKRRSRREEMLRETKTLLTFFFFFFSCKFHLSVSLTEGWGGGGGKISPQADLEWLCDGRTPKNRHSSWGLDVAEGNSELWHTQSPTVHQAATLY